MENKKKWAIGYAVFCILYFAVSVAMPHDRLESRGLEGIGKPSLKLKTEAITDDTELRFEYLTDAQAFRTAWAKRPETAASSCTGAKTDNRIYFQRVEKVFSPR